MKISPQLRLSVGLVVLLLSAVFVADLVGFLPRPEDQIRESRKILGESLAVQLSGAAAQGNSTVIESTLEQIVDRNGEILFAGLLRADGRTVATFGQIDDSEAVISDMSTLNDLVIPVFEGASRWGEARLSFAPVNDWGLRLVGIPTGTLQFALFMGITCLLIFYFFMRKALSELNPTKAVPERVNSAFNVLAEGVLILDEKEKIVLANEVIARQLGEDPVNLVGRSPSDFEWDLSGDELEELPWQTVLRRGEHVVGMPLKLQDEERQLSFTVNAAPIEDGHGQTRGVLITFDDVTPIELKNEELSSMLTKLSETQKLIEDKNRQLEVLASRDAMTGCLNRRSFLSIYEKHFDSARQHKYSLSVLMVDIDHFKRVNDSYGHIVGDKIIKIVAGVLQSLFDDAIPVGRYGGEEFIVALPQIGPDASLEAAEKLRRVISQLAGDSQLPLDALTISVGVSHFDAEVPDHMGLIDQADRALYLAKNSGRDRVCVFDETVAPPSRQREDSAEASREKDSGKTTVVHRLQSQLLDMRVVVEDQASEITRRAMHDDLTGLPNRYLLQDRLSQAMGLSDRNGNLTAVVAISLSAYRSMSELLGHEAAEDMMRAAAQRVESVVRSVDTIGVMFNEKALTFSRIAENELAMLIVDLESVESVPKIIERITKSLERPFTVKDNEVANDINCGVAVYPNDGREPDLLIRNASLARSHAERRSLRSDTAYFSRDIDSMAAKNASIASELRKAIQNEGLQVVYQPKVDAVTKQVTGAEALARWHHEELGHVGPHEFITIAENIGVIDQLTDWVWSRVCDDIASGRLGDLRVSINVSPVELYDANTADRLLNIVREKGVSPLQVEIEITESSILDNFDLARSILTRFQNAGVLVVLDDFGTAYSSLNLLLEIPVDVIKIDRCFVTQLHDANDNRAVVQAIIHMARAMGKRVVAEGVETVSERDCLILLGCREMQGYYYARPMGWEQLREYVADNGSVDSTGLMAMRILERSA